MSKEKITIVSPKDLVITWFSGGGGGGGQYRNRHNNCCRIYHPESGAIGQGTKQRSAEQNKKDAFIAMTKSFTFQRWLRERIEEIKTNTTIEERVEEALKPSNLIVEKLENGQWTKWEE